MIYMLYLPKKYCTNPSKAHEVSIILGAQLLYQLFSKVIENLCAKYHYSRSLHVHCSLIIGNMIIWINGCIIFFAQVQRLKLNPY